MMAALILSAVSAVQGVTFVVAGMICLGGALGVVVFKNPVHNALSLVATLFGVAVLYVAQEAYFLAAIQVIVYAGAIVVLFLFVIMLLGVDKAQNIASERTPAALLLGAGLGAGFALLTLIAALAGSATPTGERSVSGPLNANDDLATIGESLFTRYVFAFEITSILLIVAVVGAVVLSRRPSGPPIDLEEFPDYRTVEELDAEREAELAAQAVQSDQSTTTEVDR